VLVRGGEARLKEGTKNSMKFLNISIEDAVYMASTNPAIKLGVFDRKGSIEEGKDADLVILD
jgi:N-acetylglucosamine-6-phosphate deacetylase